MKYWETSFDIRAQGQSVRKCSNLFCLKHHFTEQNNGIIKTFSLAKDLTTLWRKAMGTEAWTISYDNVVLSRVKEQNKTAKSMSETGSWTRWTFSLTPNGGFCVLMKERNYLINQKKKKNSVEENAESSLGTCFMHLVLEDARTRKSDSTSKMPFFSFPSTQHRAAVFCKKDSLFYIFHFESVCHFPSHRAGTSVLSVVQY